MRTEELTVIPSAAELAERIRNIGNGLLSVAADLVRAVDVRPETMDELIDSGVNRDLLRRLEKLGRGQISPRLVFAYGHEKNLLALPLSSQERILDDGVEVLSPGGDHRHIPVGQLSPAQCKQVFGPQGVRTLAEQRTWIDEQRAKTAAPIEVDYQIHKDSVTILRPAKISRQLLVSWLAQMN
jgi:hypothetical protein